MSWSTAFASPLTVIITGVLASATRRITSGASALSLLIGFTWFDSFIRNSQRRLSSIKAAEPNIVRIRSFGKRRRAWALGTPSSAPFEGNGHLIMRLILVTKDTQGLKTDLAVVEQAIRTHLAKTIELDTIFAAESHTSQPAAANDRMI